MRRRFWCAVARYAYARAALPYSPPLYLYRPTASTSTNGADSIVLRYYPPWGDE